MVRRRGRLVWALAGLLALVGCAPSEGEEVPTAPVSQTPQSTEPVSDGSTDGAEDPSDEPSERPEVDPPERPAAMEQETVDGAIAAAKYFMELMPYALGTGDTTEWDSMSLDGCEFCESIRSMASGVNEGDGFATGGEIEIYSEDGGGPYEDSMFEGENIYIVALGLTIGEMELHYQDGTVDNYVADDRPDFRLSLLWRNESWRVTGVQRGDSA